MAASRGRNLVVTELVIRGLDQKVPVHYNTSSKQFTAKYGDKTISGDDQDTVEKEFRGYMETALSVEWKDLIIVAPGRGVSGLQQRPPTLCFGLSRIHYAKAGSKVMYVEWDREQNIPNSKEFRWTQEKLDFNPPTTEVILSSWNRDEPRSYFPYTEEMWKRLQIAQALIDSLQYQLIGNFDNTDLPKYLASEAARICEVLCTDVSQEAARPLSQKAT